MKIRHFFSLWLAFLAVRSAHGQTVWEEIDTGLSRISRSYFIDPDTGWVAGPGILRQTNDAGETWKTIDLGIDPEWPVYYFRFFDAAFGYVLAATDNESTELGGDLLRTRDGGKTWEMLYHFSDDRPKGAFFLDRNRGWIVSSFKGTIVRTLDGGETFDEFQPLLRPSHLTNVWFATPDTGWVLGLRPILEKTFDGGSTWFAQAPLGDPEDIMGPVSGIGDRVWIGGGSVGLGRGLFLYSWDRGQTWVLEQIEGREDTYVLGIFFTSEEEGWRVVGEGLYVLSAEQDPDYYLEHTLDGGLRWNQEQSPPAKSVGLLFVTDRHIWLAANGGRVFRAERAGTVGSEADEVPRSVRLDQNYPNPFNPNEVEEASIRFSLDVAGPAELVVFDLLGRPVATLISGRLQAGEHIVRWKPSANARSGVYFYRLRTEKRSISRPLLLTR